MQSSSRVSRPELISRPRRQNTSPYRRELRRKNNASQQTEHEEEDDDDPDYVEGSAAQRALKKPRTERGLRMTEPVENVHRGQPSRNPPASYDAPMAPTFDPQESNPPCVALLSIDAGDSAHRFCLRWGKGDALQHEFEENTMQLVLFIGNGPVFTNNIPSEAAFGHIDGDWFFGLDVQQAIIGGEVLQENVLRLPKLSIDSAREDDKIQQQLDDYHQMGGEETTLDSLYCQYLTYLWKQIRGMIEAQASSYVTTNQCAPFHLENDLSTIISMPSMASAIGRQRLLETLRKAGFPNVQLPVSESKAAITRFRKHCRTMSEPAQEELLSQWVAIIDGGSATIDTGAGKPTKKGDKWRTHIGPSRALGFRFIRGKLKFWIHTKFRPHSDLIVRQHDRTKSFEQWVEYVTSSCEPSLRAYAGESSTIECRYRNVPLIHDLTARADDRWYILIPLDDMIAIFEESLRFEEESICQLAKVVPLKGVFRTGGLSQQPYMHSAIKAKFEEVVHPEVGSQLQVFKLPNLASTVVVNEGALLAASYRDEVSSLTIEQSRGFFQEIPEEHFIARSNSPNLSFREKLMVDAGDPLGTSYENKYTESKYIRNRAHWFLRKYDFRQSGDCITSIEGECLIPCDGPFPISISTQIIESPHILPDYCPPTTFSIKEGDKPTETFDITNAEVIDIALSKSVCHRMPFHYLPKRKPPHVYLCRYRIEHDLDHAGRETTRFVVSKHGEFNDDDKPCDLITKEISMDLKGALQLVEEDSDEEVDMID